MQLNDDDEEIDRVCLTHRFFGKKIKISFNTTLLALLSFVLFSLLYYRLRILPYNSPIVTVEKRMLRGIGALTVSTSSICVLDYPLQIARWSILVSSSLCFFAIHASTLDNNCQTIPIAPTISPQYIFCSSSFPSNKGVEQVAQNNGAKRKNHSQLLTKKNKTYWVV